MKVTQRIISLIPVGAGGVFAARAQTHAADEEESSQSELAKKLQNPVANLISVPIQNNWDFGIGPASSN